MIFISC